ncbi:MAG: DUF2301 domain-containing membrane protein [Cyanothece sp. SIO1E1]|nr:DUF2301 domain-containing membrane protein [Cyanothece sp. SIO1E1]
MTQQSLDPKVYQGHFGEFTITADDRQEVFIYRAALTVAAVCFAIGSGLVLWQGEAAWVLNLLTPLYLCFWAALGVSLWKIHIYMLPLHRTLQAFWAIGGIAAMAIALSHSAPLALTVYNQPLTILGIGFTFAALTGIFFKEAFCFNRFETKFLTPLVPLLLLGHMLGFLPVGWERVMLAAWAGLFLIFASRKLVQAMPDDIGDKSVFTYLQQQRSAASS